MYKRLTNIYKPFPWEINTDPQFSQNDAHHHSFHSCPSVILLKLSYCLGTVNKNDFPFP